MPPNRLPIDELLIKTARLRARGTPLEAVARTLNISQDELEDAIDDNRAFYTKYRNRAARDYLADAFGEAMLKLRSHIRSDDEDVSLHASNTVARTVASLHRHTPM